MKRARERARAEKQKEKAARRVARAQQGGDRPSDTAPGVDPDIAHIRLGPQAKQDWQIDEETAEAEVEE